jgi:hypothetical protein
LSKPWNWHRPEQRQSWPLRSPGILSHRVPRGFLPPGRLLDQPSRVMRNPSHQLNADNRSKGHARSASTAAAASKIRSLCRRNEIVPPNSRGSRDKSSLGHHCDNSEMRSMLRNLPDAPRRRRSAVRDCRF